MTASDGTHGAEPEHSLDNFSGRLPIFPLPDLVLFPGMLQPLHIFEPRYRTMTAEALAGERLLGMGLLAPGWEADYEGAPALHPVVCVGRMLETEQLPDGRYNMVLLGLRRARVEQWVQEGPYRIARVELLNDHVSDPDLLARRAARLQVIVATLQSAGMLKGWDGSLEPLGPITDALAAAAPVQAERKQALLEELDVCRRADQVATLLAALYEKARMLSQARKFQPETPNLN